MPCKLGKIKIRYDTRKSYDNLTWKKACESGDKSTFVS